MQQRTSHAFGSVTIMLVEDDAVDAERVHRALFSRSGERWRISLVHAGRLKSALHHLETHDDIKLVLLDLGLPDVTSKTEALERIHERRPDLPIVVWSGNDYESVGLACIESGADCFLPKTLADTASISRTIEKILDRHLMMENVRHVLGSSAEGIVIIDTRRRILFANPAAADMLGFDPAHPERYEFRLPITPSHVEIPVEGDRIAELAFEETEWNGASALMATLRDVTFKF